jgi:hypothetical protein
MVRLRCVPDSEVVVLNNPDADISFLHLCSGVGARVVLRRPRDLWLTSYFYFLIHVRDLVFIPDHDSPV